MLLDRRRTLATAPCRELRDKLPNLRLGTKKIQQRLRACEATQACRGRQCEGEKTRTTKEDKGRGKGMGRNENGRPHHHTASEDAGEAAGEMTISAVRGPDTCLYIRHRPAMHCNCHYSSQQTTIQRRTQMA